MVTTITRVSRQHLHRQFAMVC